MDHDLQIRINALADGTWTPEMVAQRLVEAFDVLQRLPATGKPREFGNAWPAMMKEWADLLDPQAWNNAMAEREARNRRGLAPTTDEVSRADQALAWPMLYLFDKPLHADAVQLWARCAATGHSMRQILAVRDKKAVAMASSRTLTENAMRLSKRQGIAKDVAKWANRKLRDATGDSSRCSAIKANAEIRYKRAVTDADAWDTVITPADVMPGKVRREKTLERYRKAACSILADALNEAGVSP